MHVFTIIGQLNGYTYCTRVVAPDKASARALVLTEKPTLYIVSVRHRSVMPS